MRLLLCKVHNKYFQADSETDPCPWCAPHPNMDVLLEIYKKIQVQADLSALFEDISRLKNEKSDLSITISRLKDDLSKVEEQLDHALDTQDELSSKMRDQIDLIKQFKLSEEALHDHLSVCPTCSNHVCPECLGRELMKDRMRASLSEMLDPRR